MENSLLYLLALSAFGSLAGLAGGLVYFLPDKISTFFCRYSIPFASGVLLTVSLLDLMPESYHVIGENGFVVVLISFLASFIFEEIFTKLHHHGQKNEHKIAPGAIYLVLVGDTIHNFIDGVAIAAAFLVEPPLGLVVAISTFMHETPHEIGDFGVLLAGGFNKLQTLALNALSALFCVIGALFVYYAGQNNPELIGSLLAVAAGMFLYLAAGDFLPKDTINKKDAIFKIAALLLGVMLMYSVNSTGTHPH